MMIATPVQMRETLVIVESLKKLSIRFVPIPVKDKADLVKKLIELYENLNQINEESEVE